MSDIEWHLSVHDDDDDDDDDDLPNSNKVGWLHNTTSMNEI